MLYELILKYKSTISSKLNVSVLHKLLSIILLLISTASP